MLRIAVAAVVDAAARDDAHLGALTDEEIIVYLVVQAAFGQDDGNMDVFMLCKGLDADVDAVLVGL